MAKPIILLAMFYQHSDTIGCCTGLLR